MCYLNKVILSYSFFFFSSRRRHTRSKRDWSSDVCSSDLGLAVGIDYSLFIIHRHRRQLKEGYELTESIALANGTSGSAVLFAGITVLIALLALNVTGIPFLGLMGTVGAVSIAVAVLVALTLPPAWLKVLGMRVLSRKERARVSESATTTAQDASVKPMGTWSAVL